MASPVAIVTGGASGIGLACAQRLLERGYKVVIADLNHEAGTKLQAELGDNVLFQRCDVSDYDQQAEAFRKAFEWGGGRLDFLAANAGVDDRQDLYQKEQPIDASGRLEKLNTKAIEVNLLGPMQGIWLFRHYARQSPKDMVRKIVITSSMLGLYGDSPLMPQYITSKHGLIGLTRSTGSVLLQSEQISVNAICPAFVATGLCPPAIMAAFPEDHFTPMSTIIKAYDAILDDDQMTAQVIEVSLDRLHHRKQPEYVDESVKWINEAHDLWMLGYKEPPPRPNQS